VNYIKATFTTLFRYQPITISINDGPEEQVYSLTIANANQFGNNAFISPFSNIQDGVFEITKIKKINLWEAAIIGIRLFNKTIQQSSKVSISSENSIKIKYAKNSLMHLDGENIFSDATDLLFTIAPNSLQVIV
jgi:diacylglycerol kinase family enzyme